MRKTELDRIVRINDDKVVVYNLLKRFLKKKGYRQRWGTIFAIQGQEPDRYVIPYSTTFGVGSRIRFPDFNNKRTVNKIGRMLLPQWEGVAKCYPLLRKYGKHFDKPSWSLNYLCEHRAHFLSPLKAFTTSDISKATEILCGRKSKHLVAWFDRRLWTMGDLPTFTYPLSVVSKLRLTAFFPDEWTKEEWEYGILGADRLNNVATFKLMEEKLGVGKRWIFNIIMRGFDDFGSFWCLSDVRRMLETIDDFSWFSTRDVRTIDDLHNALSKRLYLMQNAERQILAKEERVYPVSPTLFDGVDTTEGKLIIPRTNHQLLDWGNTLANCIGIYADTMATGDCLLVGLEKEGQIIGAAEIKMDYTTRGVRVTQAVSRHNEPYKKFEETLQAIIDEHCFTAPRQRPTVEDF